MVGKLTLLILVLLTTACTSQASRHAIVYLKNTCSDAAEILVENSSNFHTSRSEALLSPGEELVIASFMLHTESFIEHLSDDYKLRITLHGRSKTIGKSALLERLSTTPSIVKGRSRTWVITENALCPNPLNKTDTP